MLLAPYRAPLGAPVAEVRCEVTCECPPQGAGFFTLVCFCVAVLSAWTIGFICGGCCPRASHRQLGAAPQLKGKGTWGVGTQLSLG